MTARRLLYALGLALAVAATVADAQNLGVGALRGDVPPDAAVGALRGSVPANAGVGGMAGSFPASTTIGGLPTFSGPSGAFAGNLAPNAPLGGLQGSVPANAPSGALTPAMPDAPYGSPTPADIARRNEALGEIHLMDRSNASADSALDRATAIREQTLGPKNPGVAEGLEDQARLLEKYTQNQARPGVDERNRADRAAELQDSAKKIRKEAERPAPKR
jgi:hypothetical protein